MRFKEKALAMAKAQQAADNLQSFSEPMEDIILFSKRPRPLQI
jgi:hypothetical protein